MIQREHLASLIHNEKQRIQDRWLAAVRAQIEQSRAFDDQTIIDSLPKYVEETAQALRDADQSENFARSVSTARTHGQTRVPLGYRVRDVATEYSLLREVIIEFAGEAGLLSAGALKCLNRITDAGSIIAVEEFLTKTVVAREREARRIAENSEAYFKELIDSSPAMIWMTDENSQCTYLSKQWSEFTGRRPEDDLGVGWLENIHPDDAATAQRVYARAVTDQGALRVDYRLRRKTGEYRWVVDIGNPRYDDAGQFIGYIGTVTDIHERVSIARELQETQARFDRSATATDLGVWYCDLPFDELNWNKEVKNHFYLPPDARVTIGTFYDRIHPDDREPTREAIAVSIRNRSPYSTVYRTTHPDDPRDFKYIRAVGWTDFDEAGQPRRFDGITLDVTQQVRTNQELIDAKASAEAANTAKSAFLANMSHEIRTPLGAIMGFADLAREATTTKDELTSYLSVVERNSTQVLRIIDDILDLAKVEAGRVELERIEFSLTEFLADFGSLFGFRARENGISFRIRAETDLPDCVCGDPTRLRQVLTNSVGNAIKFTTKGSVTLHVCYRGDVLSFGVEDTGRGISSEQAANLFQAFVQADVSTTRKFGGTGLGLVLTKRLCQLMGGDYELERSELGVGSKFNASIRVTRPKASKIIAKDKMTFVVPSDEKAAPPRGRLDGLSVLLVEDSPDNQVLIKLIVERQGAKLELAGDGAQGVERALGGHHDVVLMDIQMPVMDGHEAVRTLRERGFAKPVIALTAHAMKEEVERARRSGFTSFLTKPIHREALIALISELAARR